MDPSIATVVAGIGAAAISGAVAVISAHLASLRARGEADAARQDRAQDREHALLSQLMPKLSEALESIWWISFVSEGEGKITNERQEALVRASFWVPDQLRLSVLGFVKQANEDDGFGDKTVRALAEMRRTAVVVSRAQRLDEFFVRREEEENG